MIHRHITPALVDAAARNPAVTLTGPRQSGKTTLVRAVFPEHVYLSLEAPDVRARALEDPRGFLGQADRLVLDEIQRAPDLLSYVQVLIDDAPEPGRFIITGSQNLLLMAKVSQTLAGRAAILTLHPFSLAELHGLPLLDPLNLDRGSESGPTAAAPGVLRPQLSRHKRPFTAEDRWQTIVTGFYPPIHDRGLLAHEWLADYVLTYLERDLRQLVNVLDLTAFERFLALAAARTASELNLSALASDVGVTQQTARRWLSALETGYIATRLPPHHANYRKRLRKRPRLHFLDTGLICYLLGIHDAATLRTHPLRGAIFETFVAAELMKALSAVRRRPRLFFWRDATGHEVDIVVDAGNRLIPVEAKSGQTVTPDALKSLSWWTSLPGNPNRTGVLVHGGAESFQFRGFQVLPWFLTEQGGA